MVKLSIMKIEVRTASGNSNAGLARGEAAPLLFGRVKL